MKLFIVTSRVMREFLKDHKFLALSIIAPLIIIYFFKIFLDTLTGINEAEFITPITAFVMHFLGFLLCAIVLVQERTAGTLQRMFVAGFRKIEIIGGYAIGYMLIGTVQTILVTIEITKLFSLDYDASKTIEFFIIVWMLVFVSVMLGIFLSTFARNESQVIPFIPLLIIPSVFLSGMLIPIAKLPDWAADLGHILPMYYANNMIQDNIVKTSSSNLLSSSSFYYMILFGIVLLIIASFTLKELD